MPGGDSADCLTAPRGGGPRRLCGLEESAHGEQLYPGLSVGEQQMPVLTIGKELFPVATTSSAVVFKDPSWDFRSFDYDHDVNRAMAYGHDALDVPVNGLQTSQVVADARLGRWADSRASTVNFYEAWLKTARAGPRTTCGLHGTRHGATAPAAADRPASITWARSTAGSKQASRRNRSSRGIRRAHPSAPARYALSAGCEVFVGAARTTQRTRCAAP
jgi:hypothetical protein